MTKRVALPMYDVHPPTTDALWAALRPLLINHGVTAECVFVRPSPLPEHWRDDDLLLSQTCGYPLTTQLPDVQTVGCFHYSAPGCEGPFYRSFLVARAGDKGKTLADFQDRTAVCNAIDSHSGYNVLRKMVSQLGSPPRFFRDVTFSGGHRESLQALQQKQADITAIDCVTFALLQRYQPALLAGLTLIEETPLAPGLPLITSRDTPADTLSALRAALQQLVSEPALHATCAAALIQGFSPIGRDDYEVMLQWQREAAVAGVDAL
ncbi:phosphate/phosphite/phosphonate ABC transporter substrate-binding protein [Franconibacter daqui]|uniref:phosphate/phosphite/phosphonate ABC transporter substrate-binding protein n=1 Tax=Franconibacter daqui TaxID=2047724 RepID=UPI002DBA1E7C|nr:PhnD/SsuA/transferrin family substrate-binding protein [Franconibacter daqui]MEB5924850.1 PhnD/SsuA/transferrin family substrate-binding protein [Franconibacter daqui]